MQVCAAPKPQAIFTCKHDNYRTLSEIHRNIILHWCKWQGFGSGKTEVVVCERDCPKLDTSWLQIDSSAENCWVHCWSCWCLQVNMFKKREKLSVRERSEGRWWQRVSISKGNTEFGEGKLQIKLLKEQELFVPTCKKSSGCCGRQVWMNKVLFTEVFLARSVYRSLCQVPQQCHHFLSGTAGE